MIFSNLNDKTAEFLYKNETFKKVLDFLNNTDLDKIETGKHELADGIFANIQEYTTKAEKNGRWESHKKYIDFQYIIRGEEFVKTTANSKLTLKVDMLKEKDALYYEKYYLPSTTMHLTKNDFCVFFPEDAHEACLNVDGNSNVKKAVIKIPIDLVL